MNGAATTTTMSLSADGPILSDNETLLQTFENLVAANGGREENGGGVAISGRARKWNNNGDGGATNVRNGGASKAAKNFDSSMTVAATGDGGGGGGGKRRRSSADVAGQQPPSKKQQTTVHHQQRTSVDRNVSAARKKSRKSTNTPSGETSIRLVGDAIGAPITFHDLVQMCNMCETALSREERKNLGTQLPKILQPAELAACTGSMKHRQIREICRTLMYSGDVNPDFARREMLRRFERYGVSGIPTSLLTDKLMVRNIDMWMEYASNDDCEWLANGLLTEHVQWCEPGHNARMIGRPCRSCAHAFVRVTRHGGALWTECKPLNAALAAAATVSAAAVSSVKEKNESGETPTLSISTASQQRTRSDDGNVPAAQKRFAVEKQRNDDDSSHRHGPLPSMPLIANEATTTTAPSRDQPSAGGEWRQPTIPTARKNINRDSPDSPMSYENDEDDEDDEEEDDDGITSGDDYDDGEVSSGNDSGGRKLSIGATPSKK